MSFGEYLFERVPACVSAAVNQFRGRWIDAQYRVGRQRIGDFVDTVRRPVLQGGRLREVTDSAREGRRAIQPTEFDAVYGERKLDTDEPVRPNREPDGARCAVLWACDEAFCDAPELAAGADVGVAVLCLHPRPTHRTPGFHSDLTSASKRGDRPGADGEAMVISPHVSRCAAVALAGFTALSLAACGSSSTPSTSSGSKSTTTTSSSASASPTPGAAGKGGK